jgi:hypothetical protein
MKRVPLLATLAAGDAGHREGKGKAGVKPAQPSVPAQPAPVQITNGTLEAIKWLALVLMTLDHVNKYLFAHKLPACFELGRLSMPLFVFVLAYNLARPDSLAAGAHWRTGKRLAIYGVIACAPYIALGTVLGGWWPLNILFTLLAATAMYGLIEHGGRLQTTSAVAIFAVAGALVEYWWPALLLALACWLYCNRPSAGRLVGLVVCTASLWLINQNLWALAALPIMLAAPCATLRMPRVPHVFYVYYPAHLALIWALSKASHG